MNIAKNNSTTTNKPLTKGCEVTDRHRPEAIPRRERVASKIKSRSKNRAVRPTGRP
jgi:hypothetical protein